MRGRTDYWLKERDKQPKYTPVLTCVYGRKRNIFRLVTQL